MRFKGLDLNLLTALEALLEERNVSAAGRRVFLSQSTMSGVLARLREHFNDQLLEQVGRRMILTPFGEGLIVPLREAMRHIGALVGATVDFDPATSRRRFTVVASDYLLNILMPAASAAIAREAPDVVLEVSLPGEEPGVLLNRGDVDLVITPEGYTAPPHLSEFFYQEDHVVVGWAGNPAMQAPISLDAFKEMGHVVVRFVSSKMWAFAEFELSRLGLPPVIATISPTFTMVPAFLIGTNRISLMHRRLARNALQHWPLAIQELPVTLPLLRQTLLYHPLRAQDAGLTWLRGHLRAALAANDAAALAEHVPLAQPLSVGSDLVAKPGEAIEYALQDVGGSRAVDQFATALTGKIRFDHAPRDRRSG